MGTSAKITQSVTQTSSGKTAWSNLGNFYASDNAYATCAVPGPPSGLGCEGLTALYFAFAVPSLATINDVKVEIEGSATIAQWFYVFLTKDGGVTKSSWKKIAVQPSEAFYSVNGSPATWGITLSPAEANNNALFGVVVNPNSYPGVTYNWDCIRVTLTWSCPTIAIATTSLPDANAGEAYSQTLQATQPCTWEVTSGTLPTGLNLTQATGLISGTPSGAPQTFTVKATSTCDSARYATKELTINVITLVAKTLTDSFSWTGSEAFTKTATSLDLSVAVNDTSYVLNVETGGWERYDYTPFLSFSFSSRQNVMFAAGYSNASSEGGIAKLDMTNQKYANYPSKTYQSVYRTGYLDFGENDEIKKFNESGEWAHKHFRTFYIEIISDGTVKLALYTELGEKTFIVTPTVQDNSTINVMEVDLSVAEVIGKLLSVEIRTDSDTTATEFWIGAMAIRVQPREPQ